MLAVKGIVQGDSIILENEDIRKFNGKDVIVTILDFPYQEKEKKKIDLDKYVIPTDRGINADEYIRELRANDRL